MAEQDHGEGQGTRASVSRGAVASADEDNPSALGTVAKASVGDASVDPAQTVDAQDYNEVLRAKRRHDRDARLAGAGGLQPGIHGRMSTDEDVFDERSLCNSILGNR